MNPSLKPTRSQPSKASKGIPFSWCIAISIGIHVLFFALTLEIKSRAPSNIPVEIDLTNPYIGSGSAKLGAAKPLTPHPTQAPIAPATRIPIPKPPPQTPKTWTLPTPQTTKTVPLIPQQQTTPGGVKKGTGTSPLTGGSGKGANYGSPHGTGNGGSPAGIIPPKLLNLDEVLRNLRRFYPEAERRAGKEGSVLVAIHIGVDGNVSAVDILRSAGKDFDQAAEEVAKLMKFSPARDAHGPVAVKIAQEMIFKLEN